jgi:hypothetical protein
MEIETWDEWIEFINSDPAHVLNTEAAPQIVDGVSSPEWWDAIQPEAY